MTGLAEALARGELSVVGRHPDASNVTLVCQVAAEEGEVACVYKPTSGERALWDFPGASLAGREVLAARVAELVGWDLVPRTVWRDNGPAGPGMCQEWIDEQSDPPVGIFDEADVPAGWIVVASGQAPSGAPVALAHEDSLELQRLAALDAVLNNGDRKGGHVLRRADGRLAAIDHGVTFHVEPKLRTVLWGWAGESIPGPILADLAGAERDLPRLLAFEPARLSDAEVAACTGRLADLLAGATFPVPGSQWPALPWPPM